VALQELSSQQVSLEQRYLELTAVAVDYRSITDANVAPDPVRQS